ncbi:hypothetical protein SZN_09211 [Streptomyces zinciresistens K42]|uniref:Uncharacterized protein n=1 Tax=Streptomyces zinciresistens K42 TaxID=700597 RepID=G2G8M4_9ACTN|nr:hypothetical protein [Streptomyces zinciresistens]EGX60089.1 hypothetical protein SZN_09211 [Streptomyces zinciresistens K42]
MPTLNFVLLGADGLSPVLNNAGDNAGDLARRLDAAARSGDTSMLRFTRSADGRLRDLRGRYITVADAQRRLADGLPDLARRLDAAARSGDTSVTRFTRSADGRLRDLRGRFISVADAQRLLADGMPDVAARADDSAQSLGGLVAVTRLLWPAAIPAAASLVPLAAGAVTVAVAMGAMGLALGPQVAALGRASQAQQAYEAAVAKSGARSQEAVQAQVAYAKAVAELPPETRRAAAAVGLLKDEYKAWSDSLAADTMGPFTKGVALAGALVPKTTGLVKVASAETDRFITILGGTMASPGLDAANARFAAFGRKTLAGLNDDLVRLLRTGGQGEVGSNARRFMDWARAQGPTVASVLSSVSTALVNVLQAGSDVGVGLLQVIEVLARLVSAVPPEAIGWFLQLALAVKAVQLAVAGAAATAGASAAFTAGITAMQTAAAGATGVLPKLTAAIATMSRATKVAVAGTGIGLLLIALTELSQRGRQAPPDVDKLTSSLRQLASTGKVTGEASKAFGSDLDGMYGKVKSLTDPGTLDGIQQFLVGWTGWDSTPVKEAKANLGAVDEALAGLVRGGQSDLAAAALKRLTAEYGKGGRDTSEFTSKLQAYKGAVADAKFEQQLAAQSMGLFGSQAQKVQGKLDAQKRSADGLRQSLQALNDVNRAGLGGMIGFEAAIDNAAKAARDNAGALEMSGGRLNLNSEKARTAATALQDLASRTDEAAASARESGASWETVTGVYTRGRAALVRTAQAMGLNRAEAGQLADQILKIPDKKVRVDMSKEDAQRDLEAFNAAVKRTPGSKSVTLKALSKGAEQILEGFGLKVKRLPNGSVTVTARTGAALAGVRNVKGAVDSLRSRSITITATYYRRGDGASFMGASGRYASGGPVRGYASGGSIQAFPEGGYVDGPGTGVSDSILALFGSGARGRVSNTEYVIRSAMVRKFGIPFFDALNAGRLLMPRGMGRFADGGASVAGAAVAGGLAAGMTGSAGQVSSAARVMAGAVTAGIRDELQIASPSKKTKALAADVGRGFISGLTGSRDKIKSVAADLAKDIKTAFTGRKESSLLKSMDRQTKKLLDYAARRDALAKKIAEAKAYASDVTKTARGQAGLSSLGMDAEQVTAGGIKGGLGAKLAQIKQFTKYVGMLAKRGLAKGLIRQILDMSPESGYAYASALAGASASTLSSISKTQSAIDSATKSLGTQGADILYDSGKNASEGFLKGLESQEKDIEKLMLKIAKSMQKSIKKALGIRSPSAVMAQLGAYSTQGLARGLVDSMPVLDRALGAVSGRVSGIQPVMGRAAMAGAGGGPVFNVSVVVEQAMDPIAVGQEIQRIMLQLGRSQGAKVSLNLGGRG